MLVSVVCTVVVRCEGRRAAGGRHRDPPKVAGTPWGRGEWLEGEARQAGPTAAEGSEVGDARTTVPGWDGGDGTGVTGLCSVPVGQAGPGGGRRGHAPHGPHRPAAGSAASAGKGKPGLHFTVRWWQRLRVPSLEKGPRAQATSRPTWLGSSLPAPSPPLPPGPLRPAPAQPQPCLERGASVEGTPKGPHQPVCFLWWFSVRPFPRIYNCTDWGGGSLTGVISHHTSIVGNGNFLDRAIRVCVCGNVKNCV